MLSVLVVLLVLFFFFSSRRRHTRCSRDWSSDVCSSDLVRASYMGSPINGTAGSLLTARDPNAVLARTDYLQYSATHKTDAISNLTRATVTKSNADADARAAVQRQAAAADAAQK